MLIVILASTSFIFPNNVWIVGERGVNDKKGQLVGKLACLDVTEGERNRGQ